MELLFSAYDNLQAVLNFVFQQLLLSKKLFGKHSSMIESQDSDRRGNLGLTVSGTDNVIG